jgi:hypothetical protein
MAISTAITIIPGRIQDEEGMIVGIGSVLTSENSDNTEYRLTFLSGISSTVSAYNNEDLFYNPSKGDLTTKGGIVQDLAGNQGGFRDVVVNRYGRLDARNNNAANFKNQVSLSNVTSGITSLNPISYTLDATYAAEVGIGTTVTIYGFDASEVELHFPDIVGITTGGDASIDSLGLLSLTVQGMKEVFLRLDDIESRLDALENP